MRLSNRTAFTALVFVLMGTALAQAQKQQATTVTVSNSQQQLVVLSTTVDRVNQTLTIQGLSFGSPAPQVWCETNLMTVISATDTELVVFLPAAVPDGTHLLSVIRGTSQTDRGYFNMNIGTPGRGPAGPEGPAGPKGDTGAIGPKGDTGVAGPVGPQGEVGPAGPAGPTGGVGPQGEVGPAGATGAIGPKGDTGATGPKGDTGATGATGAQGPMGPQGLMGPLGPQGLPGISGFQIAGNSATVSVPGNSTTTLAATCPAGKIAITGGYDSSTGGGTFAVSPVASYPSAPDTWRVTLRVSGISSAVVVTLRVYAICAAN